MIAIFLVIVGALIVYEITALCNQRQGDTISELVWLASKRPLVPFVMGLICGHFFWQR